MEKVYKCLLKNWTLDENTDESKIKKALENSKAFEFMILWSILETKLFNKFCKKNDLKDYAIKTETDLTEINEIVEYFHDRYRINNGKKNQDYEHLIQNDEGIDPILNKDYIELEESEKRYLILYTIYRYRNNIFHGNKGIDDWLKYKIQIEKCIDAMIFFIDNHPMNV